MIGRERMPGRLPAPLLRPAVRLLGRLIADERVPVERQRARMQALGDAAPLPAGTVVTEQAPGDVPALRLAPMDADPSRAALYLHGGGYCIGSPTTARQVAAHLAAQLGASVVVPDYRLAPEHPYPAALEDALTAWRALTGELAPHRTAVVGDSAGGGLALALTMRLRDAGRPLPAALGLFSPWLDLAADRAADRWLVRRDPMLDPGWLAWCASAYAADRPLTDPGISPLYGPLAGLPPVQVVAGADDVLVADADRFVLAARDDGVDVAYIRVPGLWHVYPTQAGVLAEADRALEHLAAFVGEAVTSTAASDRRAAGD